MGDQQHGHFTLLDQLVHQNQNLCLDGNVQSGGGFVSQQQLGLAGQSDCDNNTLLHTTGELVGIVVCTAAGDTDQLQHFLCLLHSFCLRNILVQHDGFRDLITNGQNGVQSGHGILEDHGNVVTTHSFQLGIIHLQNVLAVQDDGTLLDLSGRVGNQVQNGHSGGGLTSAGLTNQTQGLLLTDGEVHTVDSLNTAVVGFEMDHKVLYFKNIFTHVRLPLISSAWDPEHRAGRRP